MSVKLIEHMLERARKRKNKFPTRDYCTTDDVVDFGGIADDDDK